MRAASKFKITTVVRALILANQEIAALIGSRIFPVIAPEKTEGDFIVYYRDEYSKDRTKMGISGQTCKIIVAAVSSDYDTSQDLADLIDETLDGVHDGVTIHLEDSTESFEDGKYIQVLVFSII